MNRRSFLKNTTASGLALWTPFSVLTESAELTKLTILHTNDVHSRIDPFPENRGRFSGLGGAAKRYQLIQQIRTKEEHILLLDSGDIFQGTPYFNYFQGELEIKLMEQMGYDAATIGNHDFDGGTDGLVKQMKQASFSMINCNYTIEHEGLHTITKPYMVINKGPIKIGILGVGIELDGLVPEKLTAKTRYNDPIKAAQKVATFLKEEEKCDLVICLSHLGYRYIPQEVSDTVLAKSTSNIDLILGGHTHDFLNTPDIHSNLNGEPVLINQVGWGGILLGRIDLLFEKNKQNKCLNCKNLLIK